MCLSQPITHTSIPRSRQNLCRRSWWGAGSTSTAHFVSTRQTYPLGKLQSRSGSPRTVVLCFSHAPPTASIRFVSGISTSGASRRVFFHTRFICRLLLRDHGTLHGAPV